MLQLIQHSGLVGLVLIAIAVTCIILIARASMRLRSGNAESLALSRQALLFWGVLAVLLGFVGHTAGVFNALSVIVEADSVSGVDVADALRISLLTVIMGLGVLTVAALGWLALGFAGRRTEV